MQVPLQIAFHGVDTSAAVETRIREKVAVKDQPFHVSVVVEVPGAELVAGRDPKDAKGHKDINAALADSFSAVERQLKTYAERRKDKRVQTH